MHTMYVDKPMRGHGLMQAIARVNRVFRDKPAGLIVDYIGIAQNLKSALGQYSRDDRRHAGIDEAEAVAVMLEKYEIVCGMFHGFDYRKGLSGSPQERLVALAGAIEWILEMQQREAARESAEEGKKQAHRRFKDAVLALSKAFALAAASDAARDIRDECGVFSDRPGGACQERARDWQVFRGAGPGRTADCQPRRRLDRNRRYSQGCRFGDAGHIHPLRRLPRRSAGDGDEEPRHWRHCAS